MNQTEEITTSKLVLHPCGQDGDFIECILSKTIRYDEQGNSIVIRRSFAPRMSFNYCSQFIIPDIRIIPPKLKLIKQPILKLLKLKDSIKKNIE